MCEHTLERVVVAGDMAADESRCVRIRHIVLFGDAAFLLRRADERTQVVADHLSHAGGADRDHFRLVDVVGVGQTVHHVVQTAEYCCIFGHRRGHAGGRLLEVARKVRAVIGHATLRTMHEGQGLGETDRGKHRAQRLAGLGRIDRQTLAGKIQFLIFLGLGPVADLLPFC